MILAHKIRLDLNNVQATWMARCAGTARKAFNWGLNRWQEIYKAGDKPSWMSLNKELNSIKAVQFPWMKELPWAITTTALSNLGDAFSHFFRRVIGQKPFGYPNFKKKGRCKDSFRFPGRDVAFDGKRMKLPKLGWVRLRVPLRFEGKICFVTISKYAGHWYAAVTVEVNESQLVYPHACKTQAVCGVDLGVNDLAVLDDGTKVPAPRALRFYEKKLRMLNKELTRRSVKKGANWKKTQIKLQKVHEKISNIRKAVTHNLTARLVRDFRWIGLETLNVAGMVKNHCIAKSVMDAAMAEVRRQLTYKALLAGSTIVLADRWFPSTKTCSSAGCGFVNKTVVLGVQSWICPACGSVHDRDMNAAINLKNIALTQRDISISLTVDGDKACCPGSSGSVDVTSGVKLLVGQELSSYVNLRSS